MSNFIPMVSSSPPPMDDGGGFGWDDDDDDFGGFASADTNYKEADSVPNTGWNQHDSDTQDMQNDGFADFATFEKSTVTNDRISTGDITSTNEPTGVKNLSGASSNSKVDNKDTDFHSTLNGQESCAGPLTDSGMFSAETSPVQCNEDQVVSQKSCEHSDSLDDVPTDSLSENVDQNFDSINQNSNASGVEMASEHRDYKTNNGNDLDNNDSVIVQNISPENTLNKDNGTHLCSDGTTSNNESIPGSHIEHSSDRTNVHNSVHDSGIDNMAENVDTNKTDSETKTPGCGISETIPKPTTDEQDSSTVGNSECDSLQTDNKHHEISVNEEEVRKFVDNEVISEAVRRVSESDNAESDNLGHSNHNDKSYQTSVSEDTAANNVVLESGKGYDGHNAYSEITGDHDKSFTTKTSELDSDNTGPETETNVEFSDVSDKTSVLHEDNNSHNCHSSSQNSSPEHSDNLQGENNSADKVDESCDSQSAKNVGNDTEPNESDVLENNEDELNDEDFGDFSANFSSQDLDFRKSTIPQNDSDLSLSQKDNSVTDDLSDSNNDTKDQEMETLSDKETSSLNESNASESKEEKGNIGSLKQSTDSLSTVENDKNVVVDDDDDFGDFGDFSVNKSNQDGIKDGNSVQQTQVISGSADDQFKDDDDDDDFGDFGNFSSGTTVNANDTVGENDSFANFATESTESQGDGWAAFNEPQTSEVGTNIADADDDDWGAFGDEESTSETPAQSVETHTMSSAALQNMTKHEKLVYAVTSCFIENVGSKLDMTVDDLSNVDPEESMKSNPPNSDVWVRIKNLQTSREVSYQWTKSEWNSQLFTTLHIDTRNVLIGHKKAQVPIFAAGLTLLEPVKGTNDGVLKPEVLVDTTKPDSNISQTQEAIPPAQFDWTSSGLTNPLEANNKTLNLDFLIQDQSTKSSELESEFLKPEPAQLTKPAIQPLENILANLKTSSTYKPTVRDQNISTEAQKVVQTLPDLSFMKSRVLMFPIHMDGTS